MSTPTAIAGYLALFAAFGFIFLFVNLVVGKFLRPKAPNAEKLEIYECGEPTIGSSFVQFDIRFYVVALLFIIFDVEIAFFFPWATVFGKATELMNPKTSAAQASLRYQELGVPGEAMPKDADGLRLAPIGGETARKLAGLAIADILLFFAVLMVGFAYVWRRGDLDWVRSTSAERELEPPARAPPSIAVER